MMRRCVWLVVVLAWVGAAEAAPKHTQRVILVTADGLRWQELFSGIDPMLMKEKEAGMQDAPQLRDRLWSDSAVERRRRLMPFFWTQLAPRGVVLGNVRRNSPVRVTNAYRVSYPGYSEILTGRAQDDAVRGNDPIQNPVQTVLEFVRQKLSLKRPDVALFGSWATFDVIGESRPGTVFINSGFRELPAPPLSTRMDELSRLQFQVLTPWREVRHDYITFEMALEYLKSQSPRLAYIALGETDDWAHSKRYDRVLEAIEYFDRSLETLWTWVQATPGWKDATTLVITTDHGRGGNLDDWPSHGAKVAGAEQIWLAIIGPDTPGRGEAAGTPPAFQRDVAPTILDLLGIDYRQYKGVEGRPIRLD